MATDADSETPTGVNASRIRISVSQVSGKGSCIQTLQRVSDTRQIVCGCAYIQRKTQALQKIAMIPPAKKCSAGR